MICLPNDIHVFVGDCVDCRHQLLDVVSCHYYEVFRKGWSFLYVMILIMVLLRWCRHWMAVFNISNLYQRLWPVIYPMVLVLFMKEFLFLFLTSYYLSVQSHSLFLFKQNSTPSFRSGMVCSLTLSLLETFYLLLCNSTQKLFTASSIEGKSCRKISCSNTFQWWYKWE